MGTCETCFGEGTYATDERDGDLYWTGHELCPDCDGTGDAPVYTDS